MAYNCIVLAKQVPDTKKITGQVMNDDGTVNRAALPAIFNPEDLHALEMALQIKDRFGGKISVLSMGPPAASNTLRESLFRGADDAVLITDARCAASDTLATSYILSCAVKKLDFDIVLCGRQAIDGDTAQVGPQLAEKLGVTQITYVEKLVELNGRHITAQRNIGNGWQQVKTSLPVLLTVTSDANEPRVAAARRMMKYKNARAPVEVRREVKSSAPTPAVGDRQGLAPTPAVGGGNQNTSDSNEEIDKVVEEKRRELKEKGLLIEQWDLDFIGPDLNWCGRSGSPTKVHRIRSVVLAAKETKDVEPSEKGVSDMVHELIEDKIIA